MTEESQEQGGRVCLKTLRCRRTGQMYRVEQHVECPYCSGDEETVRRGGSYKNFCEFRPGEDPVDFGFPPDTDRLRHG
jgi:hypothetical protein